MNNRLSLFCPTCGAWCGAFIFDVHSHCVFSHPGDELPAVEVIISYAFQMRLNRRVINVMAPLLALAPEEA
jgi:hypothetical protein